MSVLRIPQARVLRALFPVDPNDDHTEWPILTKATLGVRAGYSAISGSVTRALLGIREDSSSGDAHEGIIALGMCEVVRLNIDGVVEDNYRITKEGIRALLQFYADGGKIPPVRDAAAHTNERYRREE